MAPDGLAEVADGTGLDPLLRALADPTRRRVVEILSAGPRRAGALSSALQVSAPTTSKHLRVLLDSGVVEDRRDPGDARARIFDLKLATVTALQSWLDQLEANWDEQLRAFKRHAETAHVQGARPERGET
ncbi:MAG: ArsR/SmtB family transcription factor [Nitrososphaerales archaeon]